MPGRALAANPVALPFRRVCRQLALCEILHDTRHGDDLSIHRRRGDSAEGGDGIAVHVVCHPKGPPLAVQIALAAALAVLRIGITDLCAASSK